MLELDFISEVVNNLFERLNVRCTGKVVADVRLACRGKNCSRCVSENAKLALDASPAVYGNLLVVGTTGSKAGGVYCIKID